MACAYLGLDLKVFMVKCSYEQKPFRREVMRTYGASVTPSPSNTTNIGRAFGGRDHTTVLHSCDKIADQVKSDFAFKRTVDELMELVKNS